MKSRIRITDMNEKDNVTVHIQICVCMSYMIGQSLGSRECGNWSSNSVINYRIDQDRYGHEFRSMLPLGLHRWANVVHVESSDGNFGAPEHLLRYNHLSDEIILHCVASLGLVRSPFLLDR